VSGTPASTTRFPSQILWKLNPFRYRRRWSGYPLCCGRCIHYRRLAESPFNTSCTFLIDKGPALDGFLQKFQAANILPKAESEEFFARYAELSRVYPHDDVEMVSSHSDLFKPDNILFDGQRVWLVDWEAAFRRSGENRFGSCQGSESLADFPPHSGTLLQRLVPALRPRASHIAQRTCLAESQ